MSGFHLVGLSEQNLVKVGLSLLVLAALFLVRRLARLLLKMAVPGERQKAIVGRFWGHQLINVSSYGLAVFMLASIWFTDPERLATAAGLVGAGLAFALQRVITAFAGYIVILNGGLFTVGDRINMGGVRGDVLRLGFIQTTLMEMGVAPGSDAGPAVWVKSRQFTGRIVTVSNANIFDQPVYNYTRDFPYIWEELHLPLRYGDDRAQAETILLEAAERYAVSATEVGAAAARTIEQRFDVRPLDFKPRVYCGLTDNYLSMTVRFAVHDHGTRAIKDQMTREILDRLDAAGMTVATKALRLEPPLTRHPADAPAPPASSSSPAPDAGPHSA